MHGYQRKTVNGIIKIDQILKKAYIGKNIAKLANTHEEMKERSQKKALEMNENEYYATKQMK